MRIAGDSSGAGAKARVAILLCTKDTGEFLRGQMDSFIAQSHGNWELWVSDDASKDDTRDIIREYDAKYGRIVLVDGPCRGATANFLHVARTVESDAEYFAWADADDIWLKDKLERAVRRLETLDGCSPALYCGRTEVVDRENRPLYLSPLFTKPPSFRNALCQNIGGGNTMVFNKATRDLLRVGETPGVMFHDWWAYMLVTGVGGSVYYDDKPCLRYRQHGANLVGGNRSPRARFSRCLRLFRGAARDWNRLNVRELELRRELLTPENRAVLDHFARAIRASGRLDRLAAFRESGAHRQSRIDNIALYAAVLLGRYP